MYKYYSFHGVALWGYTNTNNNKKTQKINICNTKRSLHDFNVFKSMYRK